MMGDQRGQVVALNRDRRRLQFTDLGPTKAGRVIIGRMATRSERRRRRILGVLFQLTAEEKKETRSQIDESGGPSIRFWVLLVLSTVIAAFGLLTNSAAVIIGAMIIAPLMGPIVASALAIDAGDVRLLAKALSAEILGVAVAIGLGLLIGLLPFNLGVTTEMMSRTTPTLFDLFIAAASGLAGAYAMVDNKVSNALAGVAISVALVPPLATCGLLLALGVYGGAWGAFLLFLANFLAIQIAAGVVFFAFGIADMHDLGEGPAFKRLVRFGPSTILLVLIGAFMTSTLISLAQDRALQAGINKVLAREIGSRTGGQLERVYLRGETKRGYEVVAAALTPQPFDSTQVAMIEKALRAECRADIHLIVRSLASSDADSTGQVFISDTQLQEQRIQAEERTVLSRATEVVNRHLKDVAGSRLVNLLRTQGNGVPSFTAVVNTPTAITPNEVGVNQDSLEKELGTPALLTVRSVLTKDADRNRFLYEPVSAETRLSQSEIAFRARVRDAFVKRLKIVEGASLMELGFSQSGGKWFVVAIVEAPSLVRPEQVAQFQKDFRSYIDPSIVLEVKTEVAGSATAGGWAATPASPGG
jgi:uncharacterized hydrophobic protein (TIGR00271 family)